MGFCPKEWKNLFFPLIVLGNCIKTWDLTNSQDSALLAPFVSQMLLLFFRRGLRIPSRKDHQHLVVSGNRHEGSVRSQVMKPLFNKFIELFAVCLALGCPGHFCCFVCPSKNSRSCGWLCANANPQKKFFGPIINIRLAIIDNRTEKVPLSIIGPIIHIGHPLSIMGHSPYWA